MVSARQSASFTQINKGTEGEESALNGDDDQNR